MIQGANHFEIEDGAAVAGDDGLDVEAGAEDVGDIGTKVLLLATEGRARVEVASRELR